MRVEELTRELQRQADASRSWSVPSVDRLRARRSAVRRRGAVAGAASMIALVVATAGLLRDDPARSAPPVAVSPSASPSAWATLAWKAERCAPRDDGCAVPYLLGAGGRTYVAQAGGEQPMVAPNGLNRVLTYRANATGGAGHLVLVGARNAGPHSRIELTTEHGLLAQEVVQGDGGPLLLVRLPSDDPLDLRVRETGPVDHDEVLVIEEYAPLSR
jgi:hypothetical protein